MRLPTYIPSVFRGNPFRGRFASSMRSRRSPDRKTQIMLRLAMLCRADSGNLAFALTPTAQQQVPEHSNQLNSVDGFSVPMELECVQFMNYLCTRVNNNGRMQKRIHGFHIGSRPYHGLLRSGRPLRE